MAIYSEEIINIDVRRGTIHRSFMNCSIGEGDKAGNRFGFRLFNGRDPVSMVGASCVGYFIRSDGITLVISGTIADGAAYVDLPEAAFAKEGNFTLTIKVAGTGFASTMRIIDGTVVNTTTGTIADPASEVPSLADLMAVINRAETAAETIDGISFAAVQISGTRYKITVTKE